MKKTYWLAGIVFFSLLFFSTAEALTTLVVHIEPPEAVTAGAQWQVDHDGVWRNSGDTLTGLPPGPHFLEFKEIGGWNEPVDREVNLEDNRTRLVTGTYAPKGGALKVNITPEEANTAGAAWRRVGTETWRGSGDTEFGIPPGNYMVEFDEATGFITPEPQSVEIIDGIITTLDVEYTPQADTGSLQVILNPEAVRSQARWRVDGGSWHESGETQSGLAEGTHLVEYNDVPGWTKPPNENVNILKDHTTVITRDYLPPGGTLCVTIGPAWADDFGGRWRRLGTTDWLKSGDCEFLDPGDYTVEFKGDVPCWTKPTNKLATVTNGATTNLWVDYVGDPGFLRVIILPAEAVAAGAAWRRSGSSIWHSSGETEQVPAGPYQVEFKTLSTWSKPQNIDTVVLPCQTVEKTGTYTPPAGCLRVTIDPPEAIGAGAKWRVDSGDWRASGDTQCGLSPGLHTVSFYPLTGWTKPANKTVTIIKDQTTSTTGTYKRQTGSLRVTINPADAVTAGAQWRRVGTTNWFNSGTTETNVPVGQHTVECKDVTGWVKPPDQTVTINSGKLTSITCTYTQGTGSLQVNIRPPQAVTDGAKWRRVGTIPWKNSGEIEAGVPVGNQTVEFLDLPNWTKPANLPVTVIQDQLTTAEGTYTPPSGCLRVTISPSGAVSAGARWRRLGTNDWFGSGDTECNVPVGQQTVEFLEIQGWTKPDNKSVTIIKDTVTNTSGTYRQQTGSLRVTINPPEAVAAGAQWRRVGTSMWRNSGTTESNIPVGQHTVEFKSVSGWSKPPNQTVTVQDGITTETNATYTTPSGSLRVFIDPQSAIEAGAKWRVDGGTWQDSGTTLSGLSVGYHSVSYNSVAGCTKPANQTVTISDGGTAVVTGTYTCGPLE
jgi:major membrane immunogen (membrane-anchored lipoprotein)